MDWKYTIILPDDVELPGSADFQKDLLAHLKMAGHITPETGIEQVQFAVYDYGQTALNTMFQNGVTCVRLASCFNKTFFLAIVPLVPGYLMSEWTAYQILCDQEQFAKWKLAYQR